MAERIVIIPSSGVPWWGTLLVGLAGALVGGLITFVSALFTDRRSRFGERQRRVLTLALRHKTTAIDLRLLFDAQRATDDDGKVIPWDDTAAELESYREGSNDLLELQVYTNHTLLEGPVDRCREAFDALVDARKESDEAWEAAEEESSDAVSEMLTRMRMFHSFAPGNSDRYLREKRFLFAKNPARKRAKLKAIKHAEPSES